LASASSAVIVELFSFLLSPFSQAPMTLTLLDLDLDLDLIFRFDRESAME
jgi:hypothetical protein